MNSTGFALTAFGAFVGYFSWKSGKESTKIISAGNQRLEISISEGNRRLEMILQAMQTRWDQADEFNKRIFDKILDKVS